MKNFILFIAIVFGSITSLSAQTLNSYKYVVVPAKYDFLNEPNQYQLNELTKFLFEKYNFEVIMEGSEMPLDWATHNCNSLFANIENESKFLSTKLKVVLKDCGKKIIFESEVGSSREKDYKIAYHEALRDAFKSIAILNYNYDMNITSNKGKQKPVSKLIVNKEPVEAASKAKDVEEVVVSAIPMDASKQNKPTKESVEEVVVSAIPQELAEKTEADPNKKENKKIYTLGNSEFYLMKADFGFQLIQSKMEEAFANLIKTISEEHFIYSTISTNGIAFFDASGNLNVEVLAADGKSTSIKIYKLKN